MKKYIVLMLTFSFLLIIVNFVFADTTYTERLAGNDRIETAIEISDDVFSNGWCDGAEVIVCRSDLYPDALSASSLAGWFTCPILLNPSDSLDSRVEDELDRLFDGFDTTDTVYIIGGEAALSEEVEDDLEDLDCTVIRIGGTDRYDTAQKVAEELEDQ
ncbi:MAG: cell wall-binding repeat-containing protein, partial [Actinomycetia bacterium]|nr:cell wall-binding repeat-containing protein [Actinomycetes bacterium]